MRGKGSVAIGFASELRDDRLKPRPDPLRGRALVMRGDDDRPVLVFGDLSDGTGGAGVLAGAAGNAGILVGNGGDVVQLDSCDCSFSKKARSPSRDKNNVIHLSVSFKSFYQTPTVGHQGFLSYPKIRHSLMEKNSGRIRFPVTRSISSVIRKGSIV